MRLDAIRQKIQAQITEDLYYGAHLAVYHEGKWQDMVVGEHYPNCPVKPDAIYDVASVSKVLGVGTLLAFLLAEGQLDLDSPLHTLYPTLEDKTVTIRQLATHTSGVDPYIPNRDELDFQGLKQALHELNFSEEKSFLYSDVNIILLGFWLESYYEKPLSQLFEEEIFRPWQMPQTLFGPVKQAVPTVKGMTNGQVHDPKAKVLREHCGSAGLFSTMSDLKGFLEHYLTDDFAQNLWQDYARADKPRSLVWNLDSDWLDHTGYTGPFIMVNRKHQQAVIFLTNRTYAYDDRPLWIAKRRELRDVIKATLQLD